MLKPRGLNFLQKISLSLMGVLVVVTFVGANLHAMLWQSSGWLVSAVLPAVVIDLTNEQRVDNAVQPLQRSSVLDEAAQLKAEHMAQNEYFAHFSPDGVSPWYWFDKAGYTFAHAGENLAVYFTDSSELVDSWMESQSHRENIVNGAYTEIGVGTAKGSFEGYDTVYVVQLFGTPAVAPVVPKIIPVEPEPEVVEAVEVALVEPSVVIEPLVVETEEQIELPVVAPSLVLAEEQILVSVEDEAELGQVSESLGNEIYLAQSEDAVDDLALTVESEAVLTSTEVTEDLVIDGSEVSVFESVEVLDSEVVVVEVSTIATSSGLAVANIETGVSNHAGGTKVSLATQPSKLLQIVYIILSIVVVSLLGASVVMEARRLNFAQVAYGLLLLVGMSGLWYVNSLLTSGAVII